MEIRQGSQSYKNIDNLYSFGFLIKKQMVDIVKNRIMVFLALIK
jgi:hypothetical protein